MLVKRCEDWPIKLEAAIINRSDTKFEYGKHDCCMAVASIIEAMTGTTIGGTLRKYKNERGAKVVLARYGGVRGVAEHLSKEIGATAISPKLAQRGDVVLVNIGEDESLGIVSMNGRDAFIAGKPSGWRSFPVETWICGWRIE